MFSNLTNRIEPATGLLLNSIKINGNYVIVEDFNFAQDQEIDQNEPFIYGGPAHAIANIGKKFIEGDFTFPLRVDQNGTLESAAQAVLQCAEQTNLGLTIESENTISYPTLTNFNTPTVNNVIIMMTPIKVKNLTIFASSEGESIKCKVSFFGSIDSITGVSTFSGTVPLGRALTWRDTSASRLSNELRAVSAFQIEIIQEVEGYYFLGNDINNPPTNEFPALFGAKTFTCKGFYEEFVRMGLQPYSYVHGGFMFGENIQMNFGSINATILNPLFKISKQKISKTVYKRKVEFFSLMTPTTPETAGAVFNFT